MNGYRPFVVIVLMLMALSACTSTATVQEERQYLRSIARDRIITTTIFKSLLGDPLTAPLNITPLCYDGRVYLVGIYEREEQKVRVLAIARAVEGVQSVDAHLVPGTGDAAEEPCSAEEDLRLSGTVKSRFKEDLKHIKTSRMDVISVRCVVVLVGIVRTEQEIDTILETARSTAGVRDVVSYLISLE